MKTPAEGGQPPGEVPVRGRRRKRRGKKRGAAGSNGSGAAPPENRNTAAEPTGSAAANRRSGGQFDGRSGRKDPKRGKGAGKHAGAAKSRAPRNGARSDDVSNQDADSARNTGNAASSNAPPGAESRSDAQARPDGWRANKRRRRRGRKKNGAARHGIDSRADGAEQAAIRNLRSPVTPAEPPSFDARKAPDGDGGQPARPGPGRPGQRKGKPHWRGDQHTGGRNSGHKGGQRGGRKPGRWRNGQAAKPAFAALDLGTNNCRLLVAVPTGTGRFKVIDAFSRIVRLGEGVAANGRLGEAAMERALEALAICASKLRHHPIAAQRLIATEACRRAENGMQFLAEVKRRTGLELEVVDRETEARLAAEGCGTLMDQRARGAVLFDIGGGSSELVLVDRGDDRRQQVSRQIAGWTSLPLGVVTLSERHGGKAVTHAVFDDMVGEVLEHLTGFAGRDSLAHIWAEDHTHLLGTSGTVTTIAGVHLKLPRYDRRKVDGLWLSDDEIDRVIEELLAMDYHTRALNPCIGRDRADLVLAGCAILQAIRQTWPSRRLRVADRGLREGILSELMLEAGVWQQPQAPAPGAR